MRFSSRGLGLALLVSLPACSIDTSTPPAARAISIAAPSRPLHSDHGDFPGRHDADLTDLYAFTSSGNLVLVLCTNPTLPAGLTSYQFAADLTLRIHVDAHSAVSFDDPHDVETFGGTILRPDKIAEDVTFEVTFDETGVPALHVDGLPQAVTKQIKMFTGLRDDPFLSANVNTQRRNVAAVVLEMPLSLVANATQTLLIWGTSKVPEVQGPIADHIGLALWRAVTGGNSIGLRPRDQFEATGLQPDVMIYRLSQAAAFPNGRVLEDDVRHIVLGEPLLINNKPMLDHFPYLAPPN